MNPTVFDTLRECPGRRPRVKNTPQCQQRDEHRSLLSQRFNLFHIIPIVILFYVVQYLRRGAFSSMSSRVSREERWEISLRLGKCQKTRKMEQVGWLMRPHLEAGGPRMSPVSGRQGYRVRTLQLERRAANRQTPNVWMGGSVLRWIAPPWLGVRIEFACSSHVRFFLL